MGCGEAGFWEGLCSGRSGAGPVEGLSTSNLSRHVACQIREPIEEVSGCGRAAQLSVSAARQAWKGAGLEDEAHPDARTAVLVGTTMGETQFIEEPLFDGTGDPLTAEELAGVVQHSPGCIARAVGQALGLSGSAVDVYGACAAGNIALHLACRHLLDDRADIVLAGGADGFSRLAFIGFMRLRVMAAEVCRPFDVRRDGLLVGEGAAMFVFEREGDARARGAPIRARLVGSGLSSESYHPTRPDPDGDGLARATLAALADAGLSPETIDYVNAHGTGTPHNDAIEMKVLDRCFPGGVPFSSIKAVTGHAMGGAAALEAACCLLSLEHQRLIPTWNLEQVQQPCNGEALRGGTRQARVRYALNNSAGFGGYNSSVVLARA